MADDLKTIVQRMIDAGEPEEAIAEVIKSYAPPKDQSKPAAGPGLFESMMGGVKDLATFRPGAWQGLREGVDLGAQGMMKGLKESPASFVKGIEGIPGLVSDLVMNPDKVKAGINAIPGEVHDAALKAGANPEEWGRKVGDVTGQTELGLMAPTGLKVGADLLEKGGGAVTKAALSHPVATTIAGTGLGYAMGGPRGALEGLIGTGLGEGVGRAGKIIQMLLEKYGPDAVESAASGGPSALDQSDEALLAQYLKGAKPPPVSTPPYKPPTLDELMKKAQGPLKTTAAAPDLMKQFTDSLQGGVGSGEQSFKMGGTDFVPDPNLPGNHIAAPAPHEYTDFENPQFGGPEPVPGEVMAADPSKFTPAEQKELTKFMQSPLDPVSKAASTSNGNVGSTTNDVVKALMDSPSFKKLPPPGVSPTSTQPEIDALVKALRDSLEGKQ